MDDDSHEPRSEDADRGRSADPRRIRSLAVTLSDVVAAYEARQRSPRRAVLRVTPPFAGRMRARLHDAGPASARETDTADDAEADRETDLSSETDPSSETDIDPETGALHLPPSRFVAADAVAQYPDPDETEDALREDPDLEFSVERHRERHVAAVEAWREAVADAIVDRADVVLSDGSHEVGVKVLDGSSAES